MSRIDTPEAAIEEMLKWANGEKSYRNSQAALSLPADTAVVMLPAWIQADAAEVKKWATVVEVLAKYVGFSSPFFPPAARAEELPALNEDSQP